MKRYLLPLLAVVVMLPLCMGQLQSTRITPVMIAAPQSRWVELGNLTAAQAYPAVTDRDYTAVAALADANTITWDLGADTGHKRQLSFQLTADANTATVVLMGFADIKSVNASNALVDDDAVYLGTFALTAGTQTGKHSNVYADTCTATDGVWVFDVRDGAGSNRRTIIDIAGDKGYKKIVMIATSLSTTTLYAEARTVQ